MVVENVIFSSPLGGCLTWRPFATLPCCLTPPEYVTVILLVIAILFFFFSLVGVNAKKHLSLSSSLQTARMVVFFFYYTRCNTPKHVRSSPGPSPLTVPGQHANTGLFEMSQRWRAVVNIVFDLTGPRFEHQTSRSKDELVAAWPTKLMSGWLILSK